MEKKEVKKLNGKQFTACMEIIEKGNSKMLDTLTFEELADTFETIDVLYMDTWRQLQVLQCKVAELKGVRDIIALKLGF